MKKFLEQPMTIAFEKNFPEAILSITTMLYGLMLTLPPDSFQFAAGYSGMIAYAPAWVWGIAFLALGVVNMYGILKRKGDVVRNTARALFFLWFFVGFLFLFAAPAAPGWIVLMGVSILFAGVSSEYRTKSKYHDGTGLTGPDL